MFGKLPRTPTQSYFQPIPLVSKSLFTPLHCLSFGILLSFLLLRYMFRKGFVILCPAFLFSVGTLSKIRIFPPCRKGSLPLHTFHVSPIQARPLLHPIEAEAVPVKNKTFSMLANRSDTFSFVLNSFSSIFYLIHSIQLTAPYILVYFPFFAVTNRNLSICAAEVSTQTTIFESSYYLGGLLFSASCSGSFSCANT